MTVLAQLLITAALVAAADIYGTDVFAGSCSGQPSPTWMTAP